MGERTNEDGEILYVSCDGPGCWETLQMAGARNFVSGPTPVTETTGWTTNGLEGTEREYYCREHSF